MARQVRRISELPEAGPLTGDELLEIVQDGENKRVRVGDLPGGDGGGAVQSVQGRTGDVVITADDVGLGNVNNTSDADKPISTAQQAALDGKVDKVAGMGLSSNDFTDPLREKLIGLEGTHWRGTFVSLAALQAGVTDPAAGDYADVDVVGDDVVRYIWDATDGIWVAQSGSSAPITASQVKLLYESNPDTNAFTDADKAKLDGIEEGATANSTDAYLLNRANHTGTQAISTVAGLQGELDDRVLNNDSRLTNSREWIAETVPQAEAEDGTSTTRRAWTAQRVRQAIAAWWNSTASASGKTVATGTEEQGRTALGLGTAATRDVQAFDSDTTEGKLLTTSGAVFASAAFFGNYYPSASAANLDTASAGMTAIYQFPGTVGGNPGVGSFAWVRTHRTYSGQSAVQYAHNYSPSGSVEPMMALRVRSNNGDLGPWRIIYHTGNSSALPISGSLSPATDNSVSYGTAARRPTQLFAATATIGTSDAREKTPVRELTEAEYAVGLQLAREIGAYQWLEAVERKGDGAREHFGQTVQRAIEIFQQHGLDPFAYGAICYDTWEQETVEHPAEYEQIEIPAVLDEQGNEIEPARYEQGKLIREAWTEVTLEAGDRYSWRDSELFWLICAAQQRQADELARQQADILARLEALEREHPLVGPED